MPESGVSEASGRTGLPWPATLTAAAAVAADARGLLKLARSHAPSSGQALQRWLANLSARWRGLRQLPSSTIRSLSQAERIARDAGLGLSRQHALQRAPWHLPPGMVQRAFTDLPPHPAIDAAWLAAREPAAAQSTVVQALVQLCDVQRLPSRWAGLPLWPLRPGQAGPMNAQGSAQPPVAPTPAPPVAICLHLYYLDLWPTLWQHLRQIPPPWDLYLTVPAFAASPQLARIVQDHPRTTIWPLPNRGRDVLPLLRWLDADAFDGHAVVCKLHGKVSPHRSDGAAWRDGLLDGLVGSTERIQTIVQRFHDEPRLGVLAPADAMRRPTEALGWAKNIRGVRALGQRLNVGEELQNEPFPAGAMFWFRPQALRRLRGLADDPSLFPPEMHSTDGTMAHALERLVGACARADGYTLAGWPDEADSPQAPVAPG